MDLRVETERDFHNRRFEAEDGRTAQLKYYWAIDEHAHRYWSQVKSLAAGAHVLEYGCATGERTTELSATAKSVQGIDISDVAVARARRQCAGPNVGFHVMDAMSLDFEDERFDLVFGSGIVHHLDVGRSMQEVARVLRPFGTAIFWEPLGRNPAINLYRRFTPGARTPDEHPLLPGDIATMRRHFRAVQVDYCGLTSLLAVPFRSRRFGPDLRHLLTGVDRVMLSVPGMSRLAWYCHLRLTK